MLILLADEITFLLVEKFSSVDLHPDVVDNHAMGQIFEELLRKFSNKKEFTQLRVISV
ncbi:MAG: hypothetical protein WCK92_07025 [Bacteroidota bacterium]